MKEQFEVKAISTPIFLDEDGDPVVEHNVVIRVNLDMPQDLDGAKNIEREAKFREDLHKAIDSACRLSTCQLSHDQAISSVATSNQS